MLINNPPSFNGLFTCKRKSLEDQKQFIELAKGEKRQFAYKGDSRVYLIDGKVNIGTHIIGHDELFLAALNKAGFKMDKDFTYEEQYTLPINPGPALKPHRMVQLLNVDDVRPFNRLA